MILVLKGYFLLLHNDCLHTFLHVWLLYFSIYILFELFCKSVWAVGILNFLISPVIWFSKLFWFWLNSFSFIFAISLPWSFLFSNVNKYINWCFSHSKFSANIPVSIQMLRDEGVNFPGEILLLGGGNLRSDFDYLNLFQS